MTPNGHGVFDDDALVDDQGFDTENDYSPPAASRSSGNRGPADYEINDQWPTKTDLVPVDAVHPDDDDYYYDDIESAESDHGFDYPHGIDVETILHRLADVIRQARPMPLSASAMINKDEVLELVEEALGRMPEELRAARWMLKEREDYIERMHQDGEDILSTARARAEQLVQKQEVVRAANSRARQIEMRADEDARRLRLEAEDYCDQKLGSFEIVLERTMKSVRAGRHKLQAPQTHTEVIELDQDPVIEHSEFFDQDRS